MSGPLWSEDDDPRAEQMTADPGRYFGDAWERSKQAVLAERSAQSSASSTGRQAPATLVPGIVEMSLRSDGQDVERIVKAMREAGIVTWRAQGRTERGGVAGYRYFSVEVPRDTDG